MVGQFSMPIDNPVLILLIYYLITPYFQFKFNVYQRNVVRDDKYFIQFFGNKIAIVFSHTSFGDLKAY